MSFIQGHKLKERRPPYNNTRFENLLSDIFITEYIFNLTC